MLYFRPPTASQTLLMSYAGAVELIRNKSGVSKYVYFYFYFQKKNKKKSILLHLTYFYYRVIEFTDEDDLDDMESLLF